jgi:hypothetical protein
VLSGPAARAADGFLLTTERLAAPEGGEVTQHILLTDTHAFRFHPPPEWGIQTVPTNRLVMFWEGGLGAGILLRFWPPEPTNSLAALRETWRPRIEARRAGGRVIQEFACGSVAGPGLGFDLEQRVDPLTYAAFRVAVIPYPGGIAEFELRTTATHATNYHRLFRHLVGSFAAELRGPPSP